MSLDPNSEPLLDTEQIELLREAMGHDELREMFAELPVHARQSQDAIAAALAADDLDDARRAAHVLKGFASSFGAARLAAIGRLIELDTPSVVAVRQYMPALAEAIEATSMMLGRLISDQPPLFPR